MSNQLTIMGDNKKAVTIIRQMIDELLQEGAVINDKLSFIIDNNNLSIRCDNGNPLNTVLLSIPVRCMPLLIDFELSVSDELKIVAKPKRTVINANGIKFMNLLIDLYNETEKLKSWSDTFPIIALKEYPQIVLKLFNAKAFNKKTNHFKKLFQGNQSNDLLLVSFFGSRDFIYNAEQLLNAGIKTNNESEKGLLNVIDFLNHKTGANGYSFNKANSLVINSDPEAINGEVFVEYNSLDPLMAYLFYGFIDSSATLLFSVTSELFTLNGNSLLVLNNPTRNKNQLSKELADISLFIPGNIQTNGINVAVSHLVIPNKENHESLKKVISYILVTTNKDGLYSDTNYLNQEVLHIEKQVIEKNNEYWQVLKAEVEMILLRVSDNAKDTNALTQLKNLSIINLQHIQRYISYK